MMNIMQDKHMHTIINRTDLNIKIKKGIGIARSESLLGADSNIVQHAFLASS